MGELEEELGLGVVGGSASLPAMPHPSPCLSFPLCGHRVGKLER